MIEKKIKLDMKLLVIDFIEEVDVGIVKAVYQKFIIKTL